MSTTTGKMTLGHAEAIAVKVTAALAPYCTDENGRVWIEVVGSIRRRRPHVNDIDIVLIPKSDYWKFNETLLALSGGTLKMSGKKINRFRFANADIDLYFATPETWATLLLIRTGSVDNNIRLCSLAQSKGWRLKGDGSGLLNEKGERIAGDTEESIYAALGVKYQKPEERG